MTVKLLTEHHLEFLSLKGGGTGSSESKHVNLPHCLNHMSRLIFIFRGSSELICQNIKRNMRYVVIPHERGRDIGLALSVSSSFHPSSAITK